MKVHYTLSHGDTPIYQIWCQRARIILPRHVHINGKNIILILRLKVKFIQRSWFYATHPPMVIHSCDIKKNVTQTWIHVKKPYRFYLEVKHQSWKYATNRFMVIDQCAKYDMLMSKHQKLRDAYEYASKFDFEVKGQRHIGIMNIRDTLSYGDTSIWYT